MLTSVWHTVFSIGVWLLEKGLLPDFVNRLAIVALLRERAKSQGVEADQRLENAFIEELMTMPIAIETHKVFFLPFFFSGRIAGDC